MSSSCVSGVGDRGRVMGAAEGWSITGGGGEEASRSRDRRDLDRPLSSSSSSRSRSCRRRRLRSSSYAWSSSRPLSRSRSLLLQRRASSSSPSGVRLRSRRRLLPSSRCRSLWAPDRSRSLGGGLRLDLVLLLLLVSGDRLLDFLSSRFLFPSVRPSSPRRASSMTSSQSQARIPPPDLLPLPSSTSSSRPLYSVLDGDPLTAASLDPRA